MLAYTALARAYWRDDEPFALGAARATAALRSVWQARYFSHNDWAGFYQPSEIDRAKGHYGLEPDGPTARRLVFARWLRERGDWRDDGTNDGDAAREAG